MTDTFSTQADRGHLPAVCPRGAGIPLHRRARSPTSKPPPPQRPAARRPAARRPAARRKQYRGVRRPPALGQLLPRPRVSQQQTGPTLILRVYEVGHSHFTSRPCFIPFVYSA